MLSEKLNQYKYRDEVSIALTAAEDAGALLRSSYDRESRIMRADGRDIKIEEDLLSEKVILDSLKKFQYSIISEESGRIGNPNSTLPIWIVDPLDGTYNYARKIPFCAVSIALWADEKPLFGVVNNFLAGEMFVGVTGVGGWCNGVPIRVRTIDTAANGIIATGFPVNSNFSEHSVSNAVGNALKFQKIRMLGSAAMSLAYTADGRIDVYQEDNIMLWDIAGGLGLVEAAGGTYDLLSTGIQNCYTVIAGNSKLVEQYRSC